MQLLQQINESKVRTIVIDEVNTNSKLINENVRQNLSLQKKDQEGVIKRLGSNI